MLKIFLNYQELNMHDLFRVYEESLRKKADQNGIMVLRAEDDFSLYLKEVFFCASGAFYAVWTESGRYVSALRMEPYHDGFLLSGLETVPEERGRGYAAKLLHAVQEYVARTNHLPVYSHIHKRNAVSLTLHCKCGFAQISDFAWLIDGTVSGNYYTLILN